MPNLKEAASMLSRFSSDSLAKRLATIEKSIVVQERGLNLAFGDVETGELLEAALVVKKAAGQINEIVHAVGMLYSLPHILEKDEKIQYLSLGAGNTGKDFDMETDKRVAELKFINWRGGSEAIRQNSIFKDFYALAEAETSKRRCLYVLGLEYPRKFLEGGRALASVLKEKRVATVFQEKYGDRFGRVSEYFAYRKSAVEIIDLSEIVPGMAEILERVKTVA